MGFLTLAGLGCILKVCFFYFRGGPLRRGPFLFSLSLSLALQMAKLRQGWALLSTGSVNVSAR